MSKDLNITQNNGSVPYFPSLTWTYRNSDLITTGKIPQGGFIMTFNWIQAWYDQTLGTPPQLLVYSGRTFDDGVTPILSLIRFSWSGEKINIKGNALYASGLDIRSQAVTSTPIGNAPTTDLSTVLAFGGMY